MGILASIISSGCLCNNFTHYILHSISHAQRRRGPRPLIVFLIIVHDGRAAAGSNGWASTMVLWIGRCGGPGGGGEAKPRGRMVDGVVMKRLHVERRLRLMGGHGGGRQVQWRWERRCYFFCSDGNFLTRGSNFLTRGGAPPPKNVEGDIYKYVDRKN